MINSQALGDHVCNYKDMIYMCTVAIEILHMIIPYDTEHRQIYFVDKYRFA